jgi:ribosomal protein S18 acetylase RimI-like enzyme
MITIRDYNEQDFEHVCTLLAELQEHIALLDPLGKIKRRKDFDSVAYVQRMIEQAVIGNGYVTLAEDEGTIVGCIASLDVPTDPLDYHESKDAKIAELIVSASVRGKGVGSLLMEEIEKRYAEQGYECIRVDCFSPNADAYRFYKKIGYDDRLVTLIKKL